MNTYTAAHRHGHTQKQKDCVYIFLSYYISTSCVHKYVAAFEHRSTTKTHISTQTQLARTGTGFVRVATNSAPSL